MNQHFYHTRQHRRGIIVLVILAVCIHLVPLFYTDADLSSVDVKPSNSRKERPPQTSILKEELPLFDPNTATVDELRRQGLSEYAASNLIKYREAGWKAIKPIDILKVYGIDSSDYGQVAARIRIARSASVPEYTNDSDIQIAEPERGSFDPNTASSQVLLQQGLSRYTVRNLLKYRESGGRIHTAEDLLKIYGMDTVLFAQIIERVVIAPEPEAKVEDSSRQHNIPLRLSYAGTYFDPNTASVDELVAVGFDSRTATTLHNYINKGGHIYVTEDLKRIYGMTEELYQEVASRVRWDTTKVAIEKDPALIWKEVEEDSLSAKTTPPSVLYNLNAATQEQLLEIHGVGPYYSKAIIAYRKKLGGYYAIEQLLEVPMMKQDLYDKLYPICIVDGNIRKLRPVDTFKDLIGHPYIDYELAKKFKSMSVFDMEERVQAMIKSGAIDKRLIPYLVVD